MSEQVFKLTVKCGDIPSFLLDPAFRASKESAKDMDMFIDGGVEEDCFWITVKVSDFKTLCMAKALVQVAHKFGFETEEELV